MPCLHHLPPVQNMSKKVARCLRGHVANLHLLIEIRHEGNINKSHISLFRGTVLTKQKTKKNCKLLWLRAPTTSNLTWHASSGIKLTFNCCYVLDILRIFWLFVFLVLRFTRLCEDIAWEHHISWSSYILRERRIVLRLGEYCATTSNHIIGP